MDNIQKKTRRQYDKDFKIEAVRLIEKESYSLGDASLRLGISKTTLSKWKQIFGHNNGSASCGVDKSGGGLTIFEQKQLQKELARTREERDILKKALAYFAQEN
jgi:transposase